MKKDKKINWVIEKENIYINEIIFYLKSDDNRKVMYKYKVSKDEGECKKIGSKCYSLDEFESKIKEAIVPRIKEILFLRKRRKNNGK